MSSFFITYLSIWATLCVIAVVVAIRLGRRLEITRAVYWRALLVPWKRVTFLIAASGMMIIAPWTGDPTWDWFDAGFMAVFAYAGAPWVVGVLYQGLRGWQPLAKIFVALCLWMFSTSWSYDLYILLRDGEYPITWNANIAASSILYACAGMMWSLEWREGRGVIFSFMQRDWPLPSDPRSLRRIIWFALPFMLLVGVMILAFLVDYLDLLG
ncbi:MAG: hypothetical protein ACI9DC_001260 [Gammaproteobacteria bacterium]|jgi:hypothetical protein